MEERDRSLSTVGSEKQPGQSSQTCVVTVVKRGPSDKIGIHVGLKKLAWGIHLVVSKVSPDDKFAKTLIERGDIVVSINGKNFLEDPNTDDALGEPFFFCAAILTCLALIVSLELVRNEKK
jgi:C-terminal processing protease CtpA/Prc